MRIELSRGAENVINTLENAGFEAYVVGGAVRDSIMGNTPSDYDIATNAKPCEIKALFSRTIDTGIRHGTVTVIDNKVGFEVTTYREESGYRDLRHPDKVSYIGSVDEDLKRRDFTVNAMAYSPVRGFVDNYGGTEDIQNRIIRCVGNPENRFKEDALRMLRAVRFAVCLDFEIEPETAKAIRKCAVLIKNVSAERILGELNKILLSDRPERISLLYDTGLMRFILPDLCSCFRTEQNNKYHVYNVGEHILEAVKNTPNDLTLRWAALLHDIGKPVCASRDSNGIYHFYGHHRESARMANDLLHKLRMDRDSIRDILILIENHDVRIDASPAGVKRMMARTGEGLFLKLLLLQEADNRAKNPKYLSEKLSKLHAVYSQYQQIIAEGQPYMVSQLQINGRDLIKMGFRTGREIGDVLKTLLEEVVIDASLNRREYLIKRAAALKRRN
ncbi:MAG: HD domain-containing protein [Clostridiales bacterium]|nr:HD domain-containing protein [Clostridiales bacterium]